MQKTNTFDVLVVYTERVATSASSKAFGSDMPFSLNTSRKHYNTAYAYFLKTCEKFNLRAAFTTSKDIIGPGTCRSYWEFKNNDWLKVNQRGSAPLIFDKVSPLKRNLKLKRELLFSDDFAQPFNDIDLLTIFNDKFKTHKKLTSLSIPTIKISSGTVSNAILELKKQISGRINPSDFSEEFVLKDRFGAGGIDIYRITEDPIKTINEILRNRPNISFILQPFINFDKGYSYESNVGFIDIRIIYSRGKIVQRYIRTAQEQNFLCNEHQGGKVIYIKAKEVPKNVATVSEKIIKILNKENALFALDFIVSNNGNAYFLEGNINPGIYWGVNSVEDKINTKKLINVIVKELKRRTDLSVYFNTSTVSLETEEFLTSPSILAPTNLPVII